MSPAWPDAEPWPVSLQRLTAHLRSLRRALDAYDSVGPEPGAEHRAALVTYDAALDEALTMLDLNVSTSRPLGDPMAEGQRKVVEGGLAEAGLEVHGKPHQVGSATWTNTVALQLRRWTALRTDEEGRRYLDEAAAHVESLPEGDWRLEALDYLRAQGQHWLSLQGQDESFSIFTGDGVRTMLLNAGTSWVPASFGELLAELVVHEAQDLRWREDL